MGGDPWERTLWEPKGSHERGSRTPMEGNPWEPKGFHGRGPLGPPLGANLNVFCDEVTFKTL